ncbi:bestrophin family ion channel [Joostella atrarenae]|nr:bestrophin family ion channel [Joostella atrarenae]
MKLSMITKKRVPIKYIFKEIRFPLLIVVFIAMLSEVPPLIIEPSSLPKIPISIATTLGIAISVLLSFKISQSYGRWWEARQVWGAIVNDSRTLVLQLQVYVDHKNPLIKKMAHTQIAWCYALTAALRKQDASEDIKSLLSSKEIKTLETQQNIPLKILGFQINTVKELFSKGDINDFSRTQLEETITRLTSSMGKCERIKNTVFPTNYSFALYIAIYLFVIFLATSEPFRLDFILELIILVLISGLFFSLEKAAYRLQDPFENKATDTPMSTISRTIDINIRQLLDEKELPEPIADKEFYKL